MAKKKKPRKPKPQTSKKHKKPPTRATVHSAKPKPKAKAAKSGPVLNINSFAQFKAQVLEADKPVIVDFWAPWCGPCKMMAPTFLAAGTEHQEDVIFAKVNTDDHPRISEKFNIRALPTLMSFNKGEVSNVHTGVINRRGLDKEVERLKKVVQKEAAKAAKKAAKELPEDTAETTTTEEKSSPGFIKRILGWAG